MNLSHFLITGTFGIRPGLSTTGLPIEKPNGIVIRLSSLDTLPDQSVTFLITSGCVLCKFASELSFVKADWDYDSSVFS